MMKIAFFGDLFDDVFTPVECSKINPESGCPVYQVRGEERHYPGGVGCAAAALTHFDVECLTFSQISPVATKRRLVCQGRQVARIDERSRADFAEADRRTVAGLLACRMDAVVVSDYGGFVNEHSMHTILEMIRVREIPCVIDAKRMFPGLDYDGAVFKPNLREALAMTGTDSESVAALSLARHGGSVVITREAAPPIIAGGAMLTQARPAWFPPLVYQPSGAGDTFAAFLAMYLAQNESLHDAASLAYRAAAAAGFFPPFRAPVMPYEVAAIDEPARLKVLSHAELEMWLCYRVTGSLCVTNGCFDLLHAGHVANLEECRAQADHLLVLVNSDESTRRLKGAGRPVIPLADRMRMLAGLSSVSAVASFDADTPADAIGDIAARLGRKIDVLAKGSEYSTAAGVECADRFHRCRQWSERSSQIIERAHGCFPAA